MNFLLCLTTEVRHANKLVVPTSLQMGWIESPTYFCTVSETEQYVVEQYIENPVVSLAKHKFVELTEVNSDITELKDADTLKESSKESFNYMLELYMDDYIVLAIPKSQDQLHHDANPIMTGIHDVLPPDKDNKEYAISLKKVLKKVAVWATIKNVLGFQFYGNSGEHTTWLTEELHTDILT